MVLWNGRLKPLSIRISTDTCSNGSNGTNGANSHEQTNGVVSTNGGSKVHDELTNPLSPTTTTTTVIDVLESRKKIIRLLIAIVCSFAVLTLPHHARLLHVIWLERESCTSSWWALLQPTTYLCLFFSSSVNPFLYAFMSLRFREAVKDIMKCRAGKAQRKYTRTRTLLSDVALSSRSPSLTQLAHSIGQRRSASNTNLRSTASRSHNSSSNFLNHFLSVNNNKNGGVKTKLMRSESGEPLTNHRVIHNNVNDNISHVRCQSSDGKKEKRVHKSLYRNTRI